MSEEDWHFEALSRQQFREYFQPSRVLMAVFRAGEDRLNVMTVCFAAHCSYKPPMMVIAIQRGAHTHELAQTATECNLAVPGEALAADALYCGTQSGRTIDKWRSRGFVELPPREIGVPGIAQALANIECAVVQRVPTGDHLLLVLLVKCFRVDVEKRQRCLLSVGPREAGFEVLVRDGIHRIGVIA